MNTISIILLSAIVLISLIAFILMIYFLLKAIMDNQQKEKLLELKFRNKELITPLRLQAYERLALYLERINPNSIVMRMKNPVLTVNLFQTLLISTIRSEFEHNLSQQVYVSHKVWNNVKNAKEETIQMINLAAAKLNPNAPSIELATKILEFSTENIPSDKALSILKDEIQLLF